MNAASLGICASIFCVQPTLRTGSKLLRWALTNPIDRVKYEPLSPRRVDFETIVKLMVATGVLGLAGLAADLEAYDDHNELLFGCLLASALMA